RRPRPSRRPAERRHEEADASPRQPREPPFSGQTRFDPAPRRAPAASRPCAPIPRPVRPASDLGRACRSPTRGPRDTERSKTIRGGPSSTNYLRRLLGQSSDPQSGRGEQDVNGVPHRSRRGQVRSVCGARRTTGLSPTPERRVSQRRSFALRSCQVHRCAARNGSALSGCTGQLRRQEAARPAWGLPSGPEPAARSKPQRHRSPAPGSAATTVGWIDQAMLSGLLLIQATDSETEARR
ncbi:MAG: hypothetical protein QOF69_4109, partial [Solirubrobacteraceae bacterium]|nr:hypothetical protein [Solirubrobacteraceae bacterium]